MSFTEWDSVEVSMDFKKWNERIFLCAIPRAVAKYVCVLEWEEWEYKRKKNDVFTKTRLYIRQIKN